MLTHYAVKNAVKEKTLEYRIDNQGFAKKVVVPPGIEPGTHGFSVRCSTI